MDTVKDSDPKVFENASFDVRLPYFDHLLAAIEQGNDSIKQSFGRHVHWGYWEQPNTALLTAIEFAQATEDLSHQVCLAGRLQNGQKVLDVGCGFGGTIAHINDNYEKMTLLGVNIDERQLKRAKEMVNPKSGNSIEFKQGNAVALPCPDQFFDVVLAVECIFHFPDREQFFKEAWRVLKPGGYLALSDFVAQPIIKPFAKIKLPETISVGFYGKCNLQYGVSDYRRLADKIGFNIQTERDITAHTLPTYSYFRRLAQHYQVKNLLAFTETAAAEILSKTRLLQYYIYGLQKPLG